MLQSFVENAREIVAIIRLAGKVNHPLVPAFRTLVHINRRGGIIFDDGAGLPTSFSQAALSIIYDQFLTKGIDKALCAPRNQKFIRIARSKLDGISNHIAPKSAGSRNEQGIVAPGLDGPQRKYSRVGRIYLLKRNKFVEHTVIQHQEHRRIVRIIL